MKFNSDEKIALDVAFTIDYYIDWRIFIGI